MTTWKAAYSHFLKFIASMGDGEQPEGGTVPGETVTINMAPKTQDRLQATPGRYPRDVPTRPAMQPAEAIPSAPVRRPVQGLGDLAFSGPMPERRGTGLDDAGYDLERAYGREANTLPDRARPVNIIDELGGNTPQRKFRW